MKRRAFYAAVFAAVAYVSFTAGEAFARPKSSGGCSSCGVPSAAYSQGSVQATTTIVSTASGVYRQTCYGDHCTRAKVDPSELTWLPNPDDADSVSLMLDGQQVGAMRVSTGKYYPLSGGVYSEPCEAPIAVPAGATVQPIGAMPEEKIKAADGRELFFGVESNKIDAKPCYSINGKPCSKEQAFEAVGDGKASDIPDDANKVSVTIMGPKDVRESARKALENNPALRAQIVEQYYDPADPMIAGLGFVSPITVQDASGIVLCRTDDTSPQAVEEAVTTGLRKKNPNYDPAKDSKPGDGLTLDGLIRAITGGQNLGYIITALLVAVGVMKGGK